MRRRASPASPLSTAKGEHGDGGEDRVENEVGEDGRRTGISLLERRERTRWTAAMSSGCDNWECQCASTRISTNASGNTHFVRHLLKQPSEANARLGIELLALSCHTLLFDLNSLTEDLFDCVGREVLALRE